MRDPNGVARPSGTVLVCVLVCMSVASALAVATTRTALQAHRQLRRQRQLQQTELLVEAGIERAVWRLGEDAEYRGETWNLAPNTLPGYGAPRVRIVVTSDPVRSSLSHRIHVVARLPVGSTRFLQRSHVVTVHGSLRAPRPATLPRRSQQLHTHSNRQRCGEGLGEGKPARSLCPGPPTRERLPHVLRVAAGPGTTDPHRTQE